MKIQIDFISEEEEEEVLFRVHGMDKHVTQAVNILSPREKETGHLLCKKEEKFFNINADDVMYLESIDRKVFVYTEKDTLEITEKLYVLEEQLSKRSFIRVSKSMLLNFDKIYSFYPKLSGNLEALLVNQEKVIISRRYVAGLKRKLGMGERE
ncbi:LytTR family DNA-binding domain-containing protein [Lacrimispora algidixylanolytica]|uniref:Histidine kinase n=1 Tax=Lacrimispora algidixylanolytica TaxID=94868 RepID=A0A419T009_9FIRM|nr:LytTR family DNA-binding domain-containing protein [Lacrimispora algidixylanolytica]RKD30805.1 histidine kinase [Lacrimispora algidixylanolytica]